MGTAETLVFMVSASTGVRWHWAKTLSLVQICNVFLYTETLFSFSLFCFFYFLKNKYLSGSPLCRDLDLGSNARQVEEPSSAHPETLLVLHDRVCPLNNNTLFIFLTS